MQHRRCRLIVVLVAPLQEGLIRNLGEDTQAVEKFAVRAVLGGGGDKYLEAGTLTGHELDGEPVEAAGFTEAGNVLLPDPACARCAGQFAGPAPQQLFAGITHTRRPDIADVENPAIRIKDRGHHGRLSKQGQIRLGSLHGRQYRRESVKWINGIP